MYIPNVFSLSIEMAIVVSVLYSINMVIQSACNTKFALLRQISHADGIESF